MKIRQMMVLLFGIAAPASAAAELSATEKGFLMGSSPGIHAARPMGSSPGDHAARPIAILVMAVGRSGSSMVGEFFHQNKDVLYFFEPCRKLRGESIVGLKCLALLQRLSQCAFNLEDSAWLSDDKGALRRGSPDLKYILEAVDAEHLAREHDQLIETCKQRRAVAVKSIRLFDGLGGEDYDVSGFNVLHLVRDPRGVVRSQQEHFKTENWGKRGITNSTTRARAGGISICDTYKSQLDTSKKLKENRYLLVRYEDIATSPELAVELIYCWTGLGVVPPSVLTWIDTNTKMPTCDDGSQRKRHLRSTTDGRSFGYTYTIPEYPPAGQDELHDSRLAYHNALGHAEPEMSEAGVVSMKIQRRTQISVAGQVSGSSNSGETFAECLENTNEANHNPYGTRRQSAYMVSMWRTLMPGQDAEAVWEACQGSEVMSALGYDL